MRVEAAVSSLAIALLCQSVLAARGLRAQSDTHGLGFDDLRDDVSTGLSFDTIADEARAGSNDDAVPGAIHNNAAGSSADAGAAVGALDYARPAKATYYDLVGDLSSKWSQFADGVAVPSGATRSLATTCGENLNACVEACASTCFATNACQWFTLQPVTKQCALYRSLRPVAGDSFAAVPAEQQLIAGYVKTGVPSLLSAAAECSKTIVYNEKDTFCVSNETTYYVDAKEKQCAGSPLTLLRTFQNNFFDKSIGDDSLSQLFKTGKIKNALAMAPQSVGGEFTLESYLQAIAGEAPLVVSTSDLTNDTALTDAGTKTEWSYNFDSHGRVTSVSSTLSKKNLLFTKDVTTGKMAERKDYCKPALQTRFSYEIHALAAVKKVNPSLSFGGGEIASCLFTSPNGFWNLVPQSDKSRTTGCWKQANDALAKLLEWGFTIDWKADVKYFQDVSAVKSEATKVAMKSNELFTEDDVDSLYASTASTLGDLGFQADFPCAYFYRPYNMQTTFKLTKCDESAYCAAAWPAIEKDGAYFTVSANGDVEVSRALAHWAFENKEGGAKSSQPSFTYLKALATANTGRCFTETGRSLHSLKLGDDVAEVFFVTGDSKCVSFGEDGAPSVEACSTESPRYSVSSTKCVAGLGASCPTFAFTNSFAKTLSLKSRDDLVTGLLSFGTKGCLVVDGSDVSYSTEKASCSPIKATYVTAASATTAGDPVDPDEATAAQPADATAAAEAAMTITHEIDDPDPELP